MPGDFSGSERDNTIHYWESDENCVASNASPGTKQCKFELLSQEEVESRGFVWNGNSSDLSSQDDLPVIYAAPAPVTVSAPVHTPAASYTAPRDSHGPRARNHGQRPCGTVLTAIQVRQPCARRDWRR